MLCVRYVVLRIFPSDKHSRVYAKMALFNGAMPFTKKCKKIVDDKEKNETIDDAKQTIQIPR